MRLRAIIFAGTFALAGWGAAAQSGAVDPRVGTWSLVSARSTITPPDTLDILSAQDGVHVVMTGETHLDFSAKWNGHDTPLPGNPGFDQVRLRRIDRKQVEVTEKKNGAVVATVRDKVSKDGSELKITTVRAGQPDEITVWTRGGGAKAGKDPFAGEWLEDLSKTRQQQGLVLKIEPEGGNGVHFSGDYSYTGRFDGKQYDVQNSRNDTVQLQRVDAHTVDAVFRRDGQVTQRDRWVVSGDGRQMTLTSQAVLENGQHLHEQLTFQKQ